MFYDGVALCLMKPIWIYKTRIIEFDVIYFVFEVKTNATGVWKTSVIDNKK